MEEVDGLVLIDYLPEVLQFCILISEAIVSCSVCRMEEEIKCVQYSHPQ